MRLTVEEYAWRARWLEVGRLSLNGVWAREIAKMVRRNKRAAKSGESALLRDGKRTGWTEMVENWYRSAVKDREIEAAGMYWFPAAIGCYWNTDCYAGDFHIGTYRSGREGRQEFPECGYQLSRAREVIGRYATLDEAKAAAEMIIRDEKGATA